jgi:hypothetical protein
MVKEMGADPQLLDLSSNLIRGQSSDRKSVILIQELRFFI